MLRALDLGVWVWGLRIVGVQSFEFRIEGFGFRT